MTRGPKNGFAMGLVAIVMLVLLPLSFALIRRTTDTAKIVWREQAASAGRRLAGDVVVDFMSQFSKGSGYYENHFDPAVLARTKSTLASGTSEVQVVPNAAARTILIRAKGKSSGRGAPAKHIEALVRFVPLIGMYAMEFPYNFTDNVNNSVYDGPVRVGMKFRLTGSNIVFHQPVLVGQDLEARLDSRFNSQVYHGGNLTPAYTPTVFTAGVPIHDVPPAMLFTIDPTHYANTCTTSSPVSVWWEFQDNAGVGQFRSWRDTNGDFVLDGADGAPGPWENLPAGGAVLFTWNVKTYVSGVVRGRVTIVSGCSNGLPANEANRGSIEVVGPLVYPGGQLYANAESSLFLLASRRFVFSMITNGTTNVMGAYYVDFPVYDTPACGGGGDASFLQRSGIGTVAGDKLNMYGSWNNSGACLSYDWFTFHDPNLVLYPSAGVPEYPVLMSWRRFRD